MRFDAISAPTMKDLFVATLENMIISGELAVGERLPTEREMAKQMKVSRTITNGGLKELERKGFIRVAPRSGTFVADYRQSGTVEILQSLARAGGGSLDSKTLRSLMDLRKLLETECAFLAARNRTDKDLQHLEAVLTELRACHEAVQSARLEYEFMHALATASGNVVYPLLFATLKEALLIAISTSHKEGGIPAAARYLGELFDAVANKDPREASRLMSRWGDV